jgi:glycosyltransferase involved in cell wall biosynthesis
MSPIVAPRFGSAGKRLGPSTRNEANYVQQTHNAGARTMRPRVSVVIPARNEARNLPHVLGELPGGLHEVILVDGWSVDDTVQVARRCRPDIRVVRQTRNGKGNALACGFAAVTGDIVVMLDADGSADPAEITRFVGALVAGADFAKGTRFTRGGGSHDITRFRRWGNAGLNWLVNRLYGTRYSDLCYGYNAFWLDLLPVLDLPPLSIAGCGPEDMIWGDGFEIETLINVRVSRARAAIVEVGSVERCRLYGESNLKAVSDGFRVLKTIVTERRRGASPVRRPEPVLDLRELDLTRNIERTHDMAAVSTAGLPLFDEPDRRTG